MSWHYRARKVEIRIEYNDTAYTEVEYELAEYYPNTNSWTKNSATIVGETKEDLAMWLRKAADDVEKYDAIEE